MLAIRSQEPLFALSSARTIILDSGPQLSVNMNIAYRLDQINEGYADLLQGGRKHAAPTIG